MKWRPIAERFAEKVGPHGTGCWEWTATRDRDGYGKFDSTVAHRIAWEVTYGSIPQGMHVLHRCDNPPCVRPDHLFLGTNADNVADRVNKGRSSGGHTPGTAKLSDGDVALLRSLAGTLPQRELARQFGVSPMTVNRAIRRESWASIA